jgi:DNA polymerase-1
MKSDKVEELPLYKEWHNCDPDESGAPLCKLPTLVSDRGYRFARHAQIMGCSLRELIDGRRGDPLKKRNYETFIVSDFPSRDGDKAVMPLWGDARDIMVTLLTNSQFDPDTTYITCHAKCAPPNRKVAASEYAVCRRHLEYELFKYEPRLVVLLGSEALKVFNLHGEGGITQLHGTAFDMKYPHWKEDLEFRVVPVFHPKQYLATGNVKTKSLMQEDLNKARSLLADGKIIDNTFYTAAFQVVESIEDLAKVTNVIKEHGIFAFDTESPGLNFMSDPCILLQISCGIGKTWVIPFYKHDPTVEFGFKLKPTWINGQRQEINDKLKEIFEDETIAKCAHNIKYDMNVLRRHCGIRTKGWLWDTQVMHHLLDVTPPHGLKELADGEFFCGNYESPVRDITGHGRKLIMGYDNVPDAILWPYGATDAELTYRLLDVYYPDIARKANLMKLYTEESMPLLYTLAEAEYHGNHLNLENVKSLGEAFDNEMDEILVDCRAITNPDFNPNSTEQVAKALRELGYGEEILNTKSVKGYSTNKNTLMKLDPTDVPLARQIIKYRNRQKFKSTYVDNAMNEVGADGRIRYGFNMAGSISARLTCSFLHQIPKSKEDDVKAGKLVMRDMIDEEEEFVYYYSDYSQIELRVFAIVTKEEELLRVLADPNGDVHRFTAAAALMCEPHEISDYNRSAIGKPMNFGIIYGSEGASLAKLEYEDIKTKERKLIGEEMAFSLVKNYRMRYKKIDEYLSLTPDIARGRGSKVVTIFGREILIPDLNHKEQYRRAAAERSATNTSIQSPAGAISFRTMNLMREGLDGLGIGPDKVRLICSVHDSISYGVHKDYVEWFDEEFKKIAQRPIPELDNIIFPINTGYGNTWAEAERNAH